MIYMVSSSDLSPLDASTGSKQILFSASQWDGGVECGGEACGAHSLIGSPACGLCLGSDALNFSSTTSVIFLYTPTPSASPKAPFYMRMALVARKMTSFACVAGRDGRAGGASTTCRAYNMSIRAAGTSNETMKRHLLDVGPLRTLTVRRPSLNRRFPYKRRRHRCWIMSAGCEWLDRVMQGGCHSVHRHSCFAI